MKLLAVVLVAALGCGCVSLQNAKTLSVPQSEGPVVVTGTARTQCLELILFFHCRLNLEFESSTGQRVSDFPGR